MREIEFRAWSLKCELWHEITPTTPINILQSPNFAIMQYTGLKDKNGKEVYEGDIIKCSRGCPHTVEWVQEYGGTFFGGMPAFYLTGLSNGYSWTGEEEVIGNIHENPELLGATK